MSLLPFGKNVQWRVKKDKKINEEQAGECSDGAPQIQKLGGDNRSSKVKARQQDHARHREN